MRFLAIILSCMLILTTGCSYKQEIDEASFENVWWELTKEEACFSLHTETSEVLIYQDYIYPGGQYEFEEPNIYIWLGYKVHALEGDDGCWDLHATIFYSDTVCPCTLME